MIKKKFLWKLYYIYSALSIIPLVILAIYASSLFNDTIINTDKDALTQRSNLIKEKIETSDLDSVNLQDFVKRYDNLSGARVTLIQINGKVLADSREEPAQMDNHADRPEVIDALTGKTGISQRYSFTLKEDFMYAAVPIYSKDGKMIYVLRTGYPLTGVLKEAQNANTGLLLTVIFFGVIILVLGFIGVKNLLQPIENIKEAALRYSKGDFS